MKQEIKEDDVTPNQDNAASVINDITVTTTTKKKTSIFEKISRGGASLIPAGYHPLGYKLTTLGTTFLSFDGSLDSDIGRFLSTFKSGKRRSKSDLKDILLEIVRVSKTGQSMRILRKLNDLIDFCLKVGFLS